MLRLRQILGNGQAKPAAFRRPGLIPPDKTLRQFFRVSVLLPKYF